MKRERLKELLPIMQAYADGKEVQFKSCVYPNEWVTSDSPKWSDGVQYRVAVEQVIHECFIPVFVGNGSRITGCHTYPTRELAQKWVDENKAHFMSDLTVAKVTTEYER